MDKADKYEARLTRVMAGQIVREVLTEHRADELTWEDGESRVLETLGEISQREPEAAEADDRDERPESAFNMAEEQLGKLCRRARKATRHVPETYGTETWDVEDAWPTQSEFGL